VLQPISAAFVLETQHIRQLLSYYPNLSASLMGSVYAKEMEAQNEYKVDPLLGFENGRKTREMTATQEEMESAKIPMSHRDYCAGALLKYLGCRADEFPMVYKCHHQKHDYMNCQFEDYVIRMKEFEREKRIKARNLASGEE